MYLITIFSNLYVLGNPDTKRLVENYNQLTRQLFYGLLKSYPRQTFVLSALAFYNTLAQFSLYSKGQTLKAIKDALGTKNTTEMKRILKIVNKRTFGHDLHLPLRYATKIYADDKYKFCSAFKNSFSKYFIGQTGNADFDNPTKAARTINAWVNRQEIGQAGNKNLVNATKIKKDKGFVIVNSFEFELDFDTGFNPRQVKVINVYSNERKIINTPALVGTGIVKYAYLEKYKAQFISITLNGGAFTFFVALPDKVDGLPEMLQKIKRSNVSEEAFAAQEFRCVNISLPLQRAATQADLTKILKSVKNLDIVFDKDRAKFSGVTKKCEAGAIEGVFSEVYLVGKMIEDDNLDAMKKSHVAKSICANKDKITIEINRPYAFSILNNLVGVDTPSLLFSGVYYQNDIVNHNF
ncbi:serine protease inhibitor 30 [Bombyx mori]|uniref:Serpin-30 n=1 Tax=Bombyx mori TaxID=7091 RepID=C0J8H9_BOMMO|nr:serine protease inhibitor 30 [Bombyx mori]ACG61193.1 serpin-30 [Bombyx mori]